jgi:hypothetical protein
MAAKPVSFVSVIPELIYKDDLIFELKIRELPTQGTVADLRKRLTQALKAKVPVTKPVYDGYDPELEQKVIDRDLETVEGLIADYDEHEKSASEYRRFRSRCNHLTNRCSSLGEYLLTVENEVLSKELETFCNRVVAIFGELERKYLAPPVTEVDPYKDKLDEPVGGVQKDLKPVQPAAITVNIDDRLENYPALPPAVNNNMTVVNSTRSLTNYSKLPHPA